MQENLGKSGGTRVFSQIPFFTEFFLCQIDFGISNEMGMSIYSFEGVRDKKLNLNFRKTSSTRVF